MTYLTHYARDIQKATQNFTTILGQGSFGPVYKATMTTGEVAVKVLASDSKQGEREFQTEVRGYRFTFILSLGKMKFLDPLKFSMGKKRFFPIHIS